MRLPFFLLILFGYSLFAKDYRTDAKKIIDKVYKDSSAWERLADFLDLHGYRPNGSPDLEKAIKYCENMFKNAKLENVVREPVTVPKWVRGEEQCNIVHPMEMEIPILALGNSVNTPADGIKSEVIVVENKDDLDSKAKQVKGKIVLFNRPFTTYGETVQYRVNGANWASKHGAIASLIRSVSPVADSRAHTGISMYNDSVPKIPHAAISLEAANMLQRIQDRGTTPIINLKLSCDTKGEAVSHNVLGEIRGSEKPNEIFVVGGHIDAWDVGQGAHDDGGPSFAVFEAVKLLNELGLRPKRTIRVCFWTAEEIGIFGAKQYAKDHGKENHYGALEADSGVFPPEGIGFTGDEEKKEQFAKLANPALALIRDDLSIKDGGGGADISQLKEYGVDQLSLRVDSKGEYWRYHHSRTDTIDKINAKYLNDCIATLAIAIYIFADM